MDAVQARETTLKGEDAPAPEVEEKEEGEGEDDKVASVVTLRSTAPESDDVASRYPTKHLESL